MTLLSAGAGAAAGCAAGCVPGLHVYNVLGAIVAAAREEESDWLAPFFMGMVAGWAMATAIPSVLLAAPDESALLMVLPGQKYAAAGRGREAVTLTAAGALCSAFLLTVPGGLLLPRIMPALHDTLRPHFHWIIWSAIAFLILSEWPKLGSMGQGGWRKLAEGWSTPAAGILTFILSGILGLILRHRPPLPPEAAMNAMLPAFAGLFAAPWLVINAASRFRLPEQTPPGDTDASCAHVIRGVAAGCLGGGFAALVPGISGGMGGLLAGHATAQRDDRIFLVSQGASRFVYYAGAMLIFFLPGAGYSRGTGSFLLGSVYATSGRPGDYLMALGATAAAAALSFAIMPALTRMFLWCVKTAGYRRISAMALAGITVFTIAQTGMAGFIILATATGIGLIPVLYHSRRINCLGVILLPAALGMSGLGPAAAKAIGIQ